MFMANGPEQFRLPCIQGDVMRKAITRRTFLAQGLVAGSTMAVSASALGVGIGATAQGAGDSAPSRRNGVDKLEARYDDLLDIPVYQLKVQRHWLPDSHAY